MRRTRLITVAALAAVVVCTATAVVGASASSSGVAITPAPAFSDAQLSAPSGANLYGHTGDLSGSRYSSLSQINTSNVAKLRPAFAPKGTTGTVTAGNASGLNDGAAALLVASEQAITELGLQPRAVTHPDAVLVLRVMLTDRPRDLGAVFQLAPDERPVVGRGGLLRPSRRDRKCGSSR